MTQYPNEDGKFYAKAHSRHGKKVILDDLPYQAGVELGVNDEREAKIKNLGVNELRMKLKMKDIQPGNRTPKEELQKLMLEHKNVSLMNEIKLTQFNSAEFKVLCKRNNLSTKGTKVKDLRQTLKGFKPSSLIQKLVVK